jgi:hypothetical protein
MVAAPDTPGLGIEVNKDAIRMYQRAVRIEVDGKVLHESPQI